MLAYAYCDQAGLPVGSGCVESANKLVIEARLKGAGMHWRRDHAEAMVGLRTIVGTDRWAGCWSRIVTAMRAERHDRAARRRRARAAAPPAMAPPAPREPMMVDGKPTAAHPRKRYPACASSRPAAPATKR